MRVVFAAIAAAALSLPVHAMTLAENGKASSVIVVDPAATTAPEVYAAWQLATNLNEITGGWFQVRAHSAGNILVGQSLEAHTVFPDIPFDKLDGEEWIIRTKGNILLLAGGRPRGTLYAVSRFLQDQCGVRWWTPWAKRIPKQATLKIPALNIRAKPAFEYRAPFWFDAFDGDWAWENFYNGQGSPASPQQGGWIEYAGFVHTYYPLVPPDKHFGEHPEKWDSLVGGKRTHDDAQLCTTDPKLRDFMVGQVRQKLRETPGAGIISISQNDCFNPCECSNCAALDQAEGSHSGTVLALANYVAEKIEPEFPNVAVDTLAYQFSRHPPRAEMARSNVIVRLCSIECNFREPLDSPANAAFGDDLRGWARHADRLYIWDYVTDFADYVQPHPNWFVLGPNLRFFQANHVRGVFEEGAHGSHGSEMAEMRAWVLAQLLRDPQQDDRELINEFLNGYYGPAAKPIAQYMKLLVDASAGWNLTCYSPPTAKFLRFDTLAKAEKLWQQAEQAVADDEELLARVKMGHLAVGYVWLSQWSELRKECAAANATWPLPDSKKTSAEAWRVVAAGVPSKPWSRVTELSEGGLTPANFLKTVNNESK